MWETKVNVSDTPNALVYKTLMENNKTVIIEVVCWECRGALVSGGYLLVDPSGPHLARAHCVICQAIFR